MYVDVERVQPEWADDCINWLKSLRPQTTWKPSKEQIKAFEYCIENNCCDKDGLNGSKMVELYQQLKAL